MRFHCDDVQVHNEGLVKIIIYNRIKKRRVFDCYHTIIDVILIVCFMLCFYIHIYTFMQ